MYQPHILKMSLTELFQYLEDSYDRYARAFSSPDVARLLTKYVEKERKMAEKRRSEERKTLLYRIKRMLFLVRDESFMIYGREVMDPVIEMRRAIDEKNRVSDLVGEFEAWQGKLPKRLGRSDVEDWKEFLKTRKDRPLL